MYICKECGKPTPKSYSGMCQSCYRYFKEGGTINPLPEHGRIAYDANGRVICHICGRAYTRLGSHVKESHEMTIDGYKEMFGLCKRSRTTESSYSNMMHNYSEKYNMSERLTEAGKGTRIKKGDTAMRKNKRVRLQEILDKKDRKFKNGRLETT